MGFMLLLYAAGASSYVIGSIASVLVGLDAQQQETPEAPAVKAPTPVSDTDTKEFFNTLTPCRQLDE